MFCSNFGDSMYHPEIWHKLPIRNFNTPFLCFAPCCVELLPNVRTTLGVLKLRVLGLF